jgi:hypothetical protein
MRGMDQKQQRALVVEIGRNIVEEIRPQELISYRSYGVLYIEKPKDILKQPRSRDERTGFGVVETTLILTPHIIVMLKPAIEFMVSIVQEALKGAGTDVIKEAIKKIFQEGKPEENHGLTLTAEQLAELRKVIIADGLKNGLSEDWAMRIADTVIGNLLPSVR